MKLILVLVATVAVAQGNIFSDFYKNLLGDGSAPATGTDQPQQPQPQQPQQPQLPATAEQPGAPNSNNPQPQDVPAEVQGFFESWFQSLKRKLTGQPKQPENGNTKDAPKTSDGQSNIPNLPKLPTDGQVPPRFIPFVPPGDKPATNGANPAAPATVDNGAGPAAQGGQQPAEQGGQQPPQANGGRNFAISE